MEIPKLEWNAHVQLLHVMQVFYLVFLLVFLFPTNDFLWLNIDEYLQQLDFSNQGWNRLEDMIHKNFKTKTLFILDGWESSIVGIRMIHHNFL